MINKIRVKRLREFVESKDGAAKLAKEYNEIDPSYISQLINEHRSFGEKAARKLEKICGLPANYFDSNDLQRDKTKAMINKVVDQMTEAQKQQMLKIAITLSEPQSNGTEK